MPANHWPTAAAPSHAGDQIRLGRASWPRAIQPRMHSPAPGASTFLREAAIANPHDVPLLAEPADPDDPAGDTFEVEITDLRTGRRAPVPPLRAPFARQLTTPARLIRLAFAALLVLLLLPDLFTGLRTALDAALAPADLSAIADFAAVPNPLLSDTRWVELAARPFQLPALGPDGACPTQPGRPFTPGILPGLGNGPVYAVAPGSETGTLALLPPIELGARGRSPGGQKVVWFVAPAYQGPILIRGRRLDAFGRVSFNGGLDQTAFATNPTRGPLEPALRLEGDSSDDAPWPGWPSYVRLSTSGCYVYQVDGTSFSEVIVFRAVGS